MKKGFKLAGLILLFLANSVIAACTDYDASETIYPNELAGRFTDAFMCGTILSTTVTPADIGLLLLAVIVLTVFLIMFNKLLGTIKL